MTELFHPIRKDRRYTITREFCGYREARYVLRFGGEWVAQSISRAAMITRAVGHNATRLGVEPIVEVSHD